MILVSYDCSDGVSMGPQVWIDDAVTCGCPHCVLCLCTMFAPKSRQRIYIRYEWCDVPLGFSCTSSYKTNDINQMWFNHTTIVHDVMERDGNFTVFYCLDCI
jgi:hypothetical protein